MNASRCPTNRNPSSLLWDSRLRPSGMGFFYIPTIFSAPHTLCPLRAGRGSLPAQSLPSVVMPHFRSSSLLFGIGFPCSLPIETLPESSAGFSCPRPGLHNTTLSLLLGHLFPSASVRAARSGLLPHWMSQSFFGRAALLSCFAPPLTVRCFASSKCPWPVGGIEDTVKCPGSENWILTARDRGPETGSILRPACVHLLGYIPQPLPGLKIIHL